ncbi:hypothetical protein [Paenibacillus lutimineralis]|uniref:Uncharacterized protein n=1 Tax=Paenibacillus lutimineralis TaxID=2707005 RepID=A0A3Q9I6Y6_9BACL|nr:hypothetical protein [Paenibacillus lutimineralis]AZS13980.1 hypothetical protein EI981_05625 [Paenibacillus lutimineralis]
MNDPHVNFLEYHLETDDEIEYIEDTELKFENEDFDMHLKNGVLICSLKKHFSEVKEAREVVEQLLKSWEIDVALRIGTGELSFKFHYADVIDRSPQNDKIIDLGTVSFSGRSTFTANLNIVRGNYPKVPTDFLASTNVEILWARYKMYLDGKDQLLSMAYFCLSYIEGLAGTRGKASSKYKINLDVLNRLGSLSSEKGDVLSARKGKTNSFLPITDDEKHWIENAVKVIIRRIGEYEVDPENLSDIKL